MPALRRVLCAGVLLSAAAAPAVAAEAARAHGLWVWKGPAILAAAQGSERLRDFCRTQDINEVYVSVLSGGEVKDAVPLARLIASLHAAHVRVEALLSSIDADEAGPHREKLLGHVRAIIGFDQQYPHSRFDGLHLDIEPQQRPENKGAGNLQFLPGLVTTYRAVRTLAEPAGLSVNADIQSKLLKGSADERRLLFEALPRLTLMLYELSSPGEGTPAQQAQKLASTSRASLQLAYAQLSGSALAQLIIGLRTADYGAQLPQMLELLEQTDGADPHYQGWARHSYNDTLSAP
jgi:hypothetical protein